MRIVAISDIHGNLPELPQGDLLCICGDVIPLEIQRYRDLSIEWLRTNFTDWVSPFERVLLVWGNHDFVGEHANHDFVGEHAQDVEMGENIQILNDELVEYQGLTFYGTPWCTGLPNWAFYTPDASEYKKIPKCDVLLTHQPPMLEDYGQVLQQGFNYMRDFGSDILADSSSRARLHLFGHVHSGSHVLRKIGSTYYRNVSYVDENYKASYSPVVLEIDDNIRELKCI